MAEYTATKTTTTDLSNQVSSYSVSSYTTDAPDYMNESVWDYPDATINLGYYNSIPEFKKAIDALAMWSAGRGWTAPLSDLPVLEGLTGWGEDSFQAILMNLLVIKKVVGDSFAEIIRNDKGTLINLKPISPERMRVVVDEKGIIDRYELRSLPKNKNEKSNVLHTFKPSEILHLCNDRIADEIHGTSVLNACKWIIDARNEAMADLRLMSKRSKALGALEIDTEDTTDRNHLITQFQNMIKNGEVIVYPKGVMEIKDVNLSKVPIGEMLNWIQYLENFFWLALGVPKVLMGGSQEYTEAGSKSAILTFEQVYITEQTELESDLWNQLGIRITFNRPPSIKDEIQSSEAKNTGQLSIQPKETSINMERE